VDHALGLEVPSGSTLRELDGIIQAAFGWEGHHVWPFEAGSERYGVADGGLGVRCAASKHPDQVAVPDSVVGYRHSGHYRPEGSVTV
jgi:hypothetical protein